MALNDDELKYKDLINTLKNLQEVKAPQNFEADLMRRINSEKFEKKQSFWRRILIPSRLIPSAALAVAAVILFFLFNISSEDSENPLLAEPKVREDVIATEDISDVTLNNEISKKDLADDRREPLEQRKKAEQDRAFTEDSNKATFRSNSSLKLGSSTQFTSAGFSIDKSGLNFRQVHLSKKEQQQLVKLRERFRSLLEDRNN